MKKIYDSGGQVLMRRYHPFSVKGIRGEVGYATSKTNPKYIIENKFGIDDIIVTVQQQLWYFAFLSVVAVIFVLLPTSMQTNIGLYFIGLTIASAINVFIGAFYLVSTPVYYFFGVQSVEFLAIAVLMIIPITIIVFLVQDAIA